MVTFMTVLMSTEKEMSHLRIPNQKPPWMFLTITHIRNPVLTILSSSTENTSQITTGKATKSMFNEQTNPPTVYLTTETTSTSSSHKHSDKSQTDQPNSCLVSNKH
jgi:hypothetical protein